MPPRSEPTYSLAPKPLRRCPAPGRSAHCGGGFRRAWRLQLLLRWLRQMKERLWFVAARNQSSRSWKCGWRRLAGQRRLYLGKSSPPPLRTLPSRLPRAQSICDSSSLPGYIVHDPRSQLPTAASLTKSYSHASITQACPSCTAVAAACALTTVICCAQGRLQLTLVHCLERAGHISSRIKRTHRFRNCTAMPASVRTSRCAPGRTLCDYSTIGRRPLQAHLHHG